MHRADVVISLAMAGLVLSNAQPGQQPLFRYEITQVAVLGEPVILDVYITNSSGATLAVDLGLSNVTQFLFDVTRPDGSHSRVRPRGREGFQPGGRFEVAPAGRGAVSIILNEWVSLDRPGRYRVALTFHGSVTEGQGTAPTIERSGQWDLTLLPRDENVLRDRCEQFLQTLLDSAIKEHKRALLALTWIRDPVAVPFLLKSAKVRQLAIEEVDALIRIGGNDARGALEALSKGPNPWTAARAKAGLARTK